jgi:hypothetical protein
MRTPESLVAKSSLRTIDGTAIGSARLEGASDGTLSEASSAHTVRVPQRMA